MKIPLLSKALLHIM